MTELSTLDLETPEGLKAARHRLGWSVAKLADALRLDDPANKGARRVRAMEDGSREITGPIAAAMAAKAPLSRGWRLVAKHRVDHVNNIERFDKWV